MPVLELRIPPPLVSVITAVLMWLVSKTVPAFAFVIPARSPLAISFAALGLITGVTGAVTFLRAKTTLNPTDPGSSSSLVNWGVYRVTRNPMYLGNLLMLIGWAIFLSNPVAFLFLPAFILYIDVFQIAPEERALTSLFGAEFIAYKSQVRRWL